MAKRKGLSQKTRFEVFKRDSFTCQYCGEKAPDVLLALDHIRPVSGGGTNDILNLITSCRGCNAGKSNRELADTAVIDKQRKQLEELQERKEQIGLMFEWQRGLIDLDASIVDGLAAFLNERIQPYSVNECGRKNLMRAQRKFGLDEVMVAIAISTDTYIQTDDSGAPTQESVEVAIKKIGGICTVRKGERDNPGSGRLYYIRGILNQRFSYVSDRVAMPMLRDALAAGILPKELEELAKSARNWTAWRDSMEGILKELVDGQAICG